MSPSLIFSDLSIKYSPTPDMVYNDLSDLGPSLSVQSHPASLALHSPYPILPNHFIPPTRHARSSSEPCSCSSCYHEHPPFSHHLYQPTPIHTSNPLAVIFLPEILQIVFALTFLHSLHDGKYQEGRVPDLITTESPVSCSAHEIKYFFFTLFLSFYWNIKQLQKHVQIIA